MKRLKWKTEGGESQNAREEGELYIIFDSSLPLPDPQPLFRFFVNPTRPTRSTLRPNNTTNHKEDPSLKVSITLCTLFGSRLEGSGS